MLMTRATQSLIVLGVAVALSAPHALPAQPDTAAVRATIQSFADGAATQDVALLEKTLHPTAMQFINGKDIRTVDRPTYLAAITEKKMGGMPMTVAIQQVDVVGTTAQARATFAAAPFTLSHALTLVKSEGRWMIASTVVTVIPK